MVSNETLVYEIQRARAEGNTDKERHLVEDLLKQNKGHMHEITIGFKIIYAKRKEDKEDIDTVAKIAFFEAIESYNPSKGAFLTWMHNKIKFAMLDWVRNRSMIRIPVKLYGLVNEYKSIVERYMSENKGKVPSEEYIFIELNKKVKVNNKRFKDIKAAINTQNIVSTDEPIDEKGTTIKDSVDRANLCDDTTSVEDKVIDEDEKSRERERIKELPEIEFNVVYGHFFEDKKFSELADELVYKSEKDIYEIWDEAKENLKKMQGIQDIGRDRGWLSEK